MDIELVQQQYLRAIAWAQAGMSHEQAGNVAAAMSLYRQAAQDLSPAVRLLGDAAPAHVSYWLGFCQSRLAQWYVSLGQTAAAQPWLALAVPNLQAALDREPTNPFYLYSVDEARQALGHTPTLAPAAIPTATVASEPPAAEKPVVEQLKSWLGLGKQAVELVQGVAALFGNGNSGGQNAGGGTWQFNPDDYAPVSTDWGSLTG